MDTKVTDFESIVLKLASPEKILSWSARGSDQAGNHQLPNPAPERNGLFCEKIFGPEKDFECYCGKYKRIRYKGIVCEKCGVEVTNSIARRERMGHIALAAPVSHIWFLKGAPSRIGALLDIKSADLDKVIYFAGYIITKVVESEKNGRLQKSGFRIQSQIEGSPKQGRKRRFEKLNAQSQGRIGRAGFVPSAFGN